MGERLKSPKQFLCTFSDCNAVFSKLWRLEAHLCKHTGLRPFSCVNCEKSYCTQYQLNRHERSHSSEKPHRCTANECSEVFATVGSMKSHMSRVHQLQKQLHQCDQEGCGMEFHKRSQLRAHVCEHQPLQLFRCTFKGCEKEFSSAGKLKHHAKVHQGYSCSEEVCSFWAKTWTELLKHRREHKVQVQCGECQKLFNNDWFLRLHRLRVHSGERRLLRCPREGCEEKFTRRSKLERHVQGDHGAEKVFSCAHAGCRKSFALKESLWKHGVVHDPLRKLKKPNPKKQSRKEKQNTMPAAAASEETLKLAAKLHSTILADDKS